jgi:1-acyl-sn-glycerol-3-phosphate acyltransferase
VRVASDNRVSIARLVYAAYATAIALIVAAVFWPIVVLVPSNQPWRYKAVRFAGTLLLRLVGVRLTVVGALPAKGPVVVIANHASFIDGLVLILALDQPMTFVVGSAFARMPVVGRFLSRIGCVFVGTGTTKEALGLIDHLGSVVNGGQSVASFPEGGLGQTADLRGFHLGPFRTAVGAAIPVVPVAIEGSWSILAPGWPPIPRHGQLRVIVGAEIRPAGSGWRAHVALRNTAHSAVAALLEAQG